LFIDIRDYTGIVQCVVNSDNPNIELYSKIKPESVIGVDGLVKRRPEGTANENLATGDLELVIHYIEIVNPADVLPFEVYGDTEVNDEMRLKYRFLDLRRTRMAKNLKFRSEVIRAIREKMWYFDFQEINTPILTASSPEGARDYLVPSRIHPGKFYALPQAPQIFKQILMASGVEKYFQIAPCFRDESGRSDRSPGEFYQLDLEMAWATQDDIFSLVEHVVGSVFNQFGRYGIDNICPWRKYPYKKAIELFGTDKPDLRAKLVSWDVTDAFRNGNDFMSKIVSKCVDF
jgi:aspartyl-tRNA synthetase